jgi:RNA polymerase sigma-70 factor (sigma-E family)
VRDRRDDFDGFVADAATRLLRIAYLLTGNHEDAEDLLQDVLERVYLAWPRIDDPYSYTRTALARRAANRWRLRGRHPETLMDLEMLTLAVGDSPERTRLPDTTAEIDDRRLLMNALMSLPPHQRAVVVLRYFDDLTESQAAAVLGCSVGAVKSQSSRAVSRLRSVLDPSAPGLGGAS